MQFDDEYFGTPAHIGLARRTRDIFPPISSGPRFASYGRNVLLLGDQGAETAPLIAAIILGAHAIMHMRESHSVRSFSTGVKADNAAPLAVCAKQGVAPSDWSFAACTDPGNSRERR